MNNRIKAIRKYLKMTQEEFGKEITVTRECINRIEAGKEKPSRMFLKLLVLRFGVNEDWLLNGKDEMYSTLNTINYPIEVNEIKLYKDTLQIYDVGTLVKVKPCAAEYNGKTFAGILLGDLQQSSMISYIRESKTLRIIPWMNPAIWIPGVNEIIWGSNSWWSPISDVSELKDINTEDIENCWYMQILKSAIESDGDKNGCN